MQKICLNLATKTPEHYNDVIEIVLISLVLTLNKCSGALIVNLCSEVVN